MKNFINLSALAMLCYSVSAAAQTSEVSSIIRQKDSVFWAAYNSCDVEAMKPFVDDDVEFYHDKGGITLGWEDFRSSIKNNLCGSNNFRLRREAIPNSVSIFPMNKDGKVYGAIISGQHYFYVTESGKKEHLDGMARFTHLWLLKDGNWKMTRILSYDHGAVPYVNLRKTIPISKKTLASHVGKYSSKNGLITIENGEGSLSLISNGKKFQLFPQSENLFFVEDRDLTFEFVKDSKGGISKMIVREFGEVQEEDPVLR